MSTPLRVLLIEDSGADAELLLIELRRAGYAPAYERVDTASATSAALDRQTWDLIIADYVIPQFSGLAALNLIKQRDMDIPFIIVSGKIGEEIAVDVMKAGAHDYITKDNLSRLVPAIQRELSDAIVRRERRQALEALRRSEERFRRLAENARDIIYRVDLRPGVTISYISPAVARILGYTPAECYIDTEQLRKLVHTEDRHLLDSMMEDSGVTRALSVRCRHKDGHFVWIELRNTPILGDDGTITAIEGIARDISGQKQMEERLLRAQRLETAGRIAGQVAHDFNNLLSPLIAYPQLIKRQLPSGHPVTRFCDSLEKAAQQMARINEDLLALGRRGHHNIEPIDINRLITQSVEEMPDRPPTLKIETDLAESLPPVNGSEVQLTRVIANLLSNAREAMQDTGELWITTATVQVDRAIGRYNLVEVGEYVRLKIGDSGCGMPSAVLDKIFDPFFTTKRADKRRGSGLGLSIVQGIVSDHHGYVDVESEVGVGTTFTIYLPICLEKQQIIPVEEHPQGNEVILVVDDDELQLGVTRELLETLGYSVITASHGEQALSCLREQKADLMILDMVMPPGIDGAETFRQALKIRPDQRAIILSGYSEVERVQEARALGLNAYLRKPVTLDKLAQAVRQELERIN